MICHDFKGGIGTASRVAGAGNEHWTVGVLVQANHGRRERFQVNGVPVGLEVGESVVPGSDAAVPPGSGSIIGIVATDAPLLPLQCRRLAQRASFGVARTGGVGENNSGDLFLAFATGNRGMHRIADDAADVTEVRTLRNNAMNPLFDAVVEATEEAILNAILASPTMTGRGRTAHTLPPDLLLAALAKYGRPAAPPPTGR
jgi:D-aminopeptidase